MTCKSTLRHIFTHLKKASKHDDIKILLWFRYKNDNMLKFWHSSISEIFDFIIVLTSYLWNEASTKVAYFIQKCVFLWKNQIILLNFSWWWHVKKVTALSLCANLTWCWPWGVQEDQPSESGKTHVTSRPSSEEIEIRVPHQEPQSPFFL